MIGNVCELLTPTIALYHALLVDNNVMDFFIGFPCKLSCYYLSEVTLIKILRLDYSKDQKIFLKWCHHTSYSNALMV